MARRSLLAATLALAVTAFVVVSATRDDPSPTPSAFLQEYVEDDGRVARHDQGGDTVSEGQAYAMLLAVAHDDEEVFRRVWSWTEEHLQQPEGWLAWHWAEGEVVDASSASDADLDAARALLLAADRFDDAQLAQDAVRLGEAVLEHQTTETPAGRVLLAGSWAAQEPHAFNPSYVSPVATRLLAEATGDDRWHELEVGSRAAVQALTRDGSLPPDWAALGGDGAVWATSSPDGAPVRYADDAARTVVRHAESCVAADQAVAAGASERLGAHDTAYAELGLDGHPLVGHSSPVAHVGRAGAAARAGSLDGAEVELAAAAGLESQSPSYYGAAWAELGEVLLTDPALGGCPPLQ